MSMILRVAAKESTAQADLAKVQSTIHNAASVFRDLHKLVEELKTKLKSADRTGLPEGQVWTTPIIEWGHEWGEVSKGLYDLSQEIYYIQLPNMPTIGGRNPELNRGDVEHLLDTRRNGLKVALQPYFYGSKMAYKVSDVQDMIEEAQGLLGREKELAKLSKALATQGKSPKFK